MEVNNSPLTIATAEALLVYIKENEVDSADQQNKPLEYGNQFVDTNVETEAKQRTEQVLQWVLDSDISMPPGITTPVIEQLLQSVKDSEPFKLRYALASRWDYLDYFTKEFIRERNGGLI